MRLLMVELTRLRWRRAVLLLSLAAVLLPALMWGAITWDTRPVSDSEVAEAKVMAEQQIQDQKDEFQRCTDNPTAYAETYDYGDAGLVCEDMVGLPDETSRDEYIWYLERQPLDFNEVLSGVSISASAIMLALVVLMGATFAGADWASGSMSNQLLFENRRTRLWLAKAGAVLIAGLVVAVVAMAIFWALFALTVALRDIDVTDEMWGRALTQSTRAAVTASLAGVGGYALTMLFRNTIATLGLALVAVVGSSLLIAVLPLANPERWMIHANGLAILQDGYEYWPPTDYSCDSQASCDALMLHVSMSQGIAYFAIALGVVVVASLVSFRRRDVP